MCAAEKWLIEQEFGYTPGGFRSATLNNSLAAFPDGTREGFYMFRLSGSPNSFLQHVQILQPRTGIK